MSKFRLNKERLILSTSTIDLFYAFLKRKIYLQQSGIEYIANGKLNEVLILWIFQIPWFMEYPVL